MGDVQLKRLLLVTALACGICVPTAAWGQKGPVPTVNPGTWIVENDYPSQALREERGGVVRFRLTVGSDGNVQKCDVTQTSGSQDLDQATCDALMMRAKFSPGRDAAGKPVVSSYANAIRWTIPVEEPPVAPDGSTGGAAAKPSSPPALQPNYPVTTASTTPARPVIREPRYALLVGNAQYNNSLGALTNPVRDVQLVAQALQRAGFTVEVVTNANQRALKAAIARFGRNLLAGGTRSTGLFYYAGHGVQAHGTNYLIPVDAAVQTEADLDLDGVPADAVVSQMAQSGAATSIVILDACRNMPLVRQSRGGERGLARMDAPNGTYIAYSTAPGQTASDGTGTNSPFALALVAEMAKPDVPIDSMFLNVRSSVYRATAGKQTTWTASSLFENFTFIPTKP